jgi:hypothetical protein
MLALASSDRARLENTPTMAFLVMSASKTACVDVQPMALPPRRKIENFPPKRSDSSEKVLK